jgi:hypothetical protein
LADYSEQDDEGGLGLLLRSAGPDTTPLPGCEERVLGRLLAAMEAQGSGHAPHATGRPKRIRLLRIASAAAAVIVAGLVAWWLIEGNVPTAKADFAEMLRRVRQATTVSYDVTMRRPGLPEVKTQVLLACSGRSRVTFPDGRTHIYNKAVRKCLVLTPDTRKATLLTVEASYQDHVGELQETGASQGQFAGNERLNDQDVSVYQVLQERGAMRVWVDPEQELPVRIEVRSRGDDGRETVALLDNFLWNQAFPDSLFSLEAPPGYTLEQPHETLAEQSLVDLLRSCAKMGQGAFPARLDAKTILALVLEHHPTGVAQHTVDSSGKTTVTDIGDEAKEIYKTCLRGLAFIEQVSANGSWQYVGQDVRAGDGTSAVCWWRPPASPTFRAVYGDLRIRDVPAELLPQPVRQGDTKPTNDSPP